MWTQVYGSIGIKLMAESRFRITCQIVLRLQLGLRPRMCARILKVIKNEPEIDTLGI